MQINTEITMNSKKIYILLLSVVVVFLFVYPWTKEVHTFRAKDVNWEILKSAVKTKTFDKKTFSFYQKYELNRKIQNLNNKEIRIKGFLKKEKIGKQIDFLLTETVTNVCFGCDHDEHYNLIQLFPQKNEIQIFDTLQNDKMINVSGIFEINQKQYSRFVFLLKKVHFEKY